VNISAKTKIFLKIFWDVHLGLRYYRFMKKTDLKNLMLVPLQIFSLWNVTFSEKDHFYPTSAYLNTTFFKRQCHEILNLWFLINQTASSGPIRGSLTHFLLSINFLRVIQLLNGLPNVGNTGESS